MATSSERWRGLRAPAQFSPEAMLRDLGDGLVLRRASEADADALDDFNTSAHAGPPDWTPVPWVGAWTRELCDGSHPRMQARDFLIVEDTKSRRIASSLCLVPLRLRYGEVAFDAGQVELVGTHPEYRRRGLVAAQFEVVHGWSERRGQRLQLIDGIPWYYRQFGYEMALEQNARRVLARGDLPTKQPASGAGYRVREATAEDARFLAETYAAARRRSLVSCERDEESWRFEVRRSRLSAFRRVLWIVEDPTGAPAGYIAHAPVLLERGHLFAALEAAEDRHWPHVTTTALHHLRQVGEALGKAKPDPFEGLFLVIGTRHPVDEVLPPYVARVPPTYAFYVRVPDLAGFLMLVAPTLEQRLANSPFAGYSGELEISFYHSGLRLRLEQGRLVAVETWQPSTDQRGHLAFPDLTFLQVVFGYRSGRELERFRPDCVVWDRNRAPLHDALFAKASSDVWPTL